MEVETEEEEEVVRDVGEYFVLGRIILSYSDDHVSPTKYLINDAN